jgi:hypothetical protein
MNSRNTNTNTSIITYQGKHAIKPAKTTINSVAFSALTSALMLLCLTIPAQAKTPDKSITLTVKPKICVLNNQRENCKDKLVISWQSQKVQSLCLYSSQKEGDLACWRESYSGETEQLIKTKESLLFYLKRNGIIVAQQKLEVFKSFAKRNKRSRKRHPWSLF